MGKRKVEEDSREELISLSLSYFYILFVSLILRGISLVFQLEPTYSRSI
jgi:hypothetical protein